MEKTYFLTVFDRSGETLLNEKITADNDKKAKELGRHRLMEQQYT
ncbi:YhzD family protein, partial [Bacillus safensis]